MQKSYIIDDQQTKISSWKDYVEVHQREKKKVMK